jgi:riboflavin kinase/FMN adenylyltransferase
MYVLASEIDQLSLPSEWADHESLLTVGAFDGIHVGHQALIRQLVAQAKREGRLSGLVTFYPHPAVVLSPRRSPLYLTTPGEKTALLEPLGLDWMAIIPFTAHLAAMPPREFVHHLYRGVNMRGLWVGEDFALGRNREGDIKTLQQLGQDVGFQVQRISDVTQGESKIGSSEIRMLLCHGHVQEAARLLGRYYSVSGEVVHGAQRGRCLGFPTANVRIPPDRVVPANGIYATFAYLNSKCYPSVTNIGVRPTFDNGERSVETYLFDFDQDIYGCDLVVAFVSRLRPERRFADVKALIAQMEHDAEQARQVLTADVVLPQNHKANCTFNGTS